MKITKILNYGIIAGVIVSALSFFLKIIPCTTSPVIAEPKYSWGLCKLPWRGLYHGSISRNGGRD